MKLGIAEHGEFIKGLESGSLFKARAATITSGGVGFRRRMERGLEGDLESRPWLACLWTKPATDNVRQYILLGRLVASNDVYELLHKVRLERLIVVAGLWPVSSLALWRFGLTNSGLSPLTLG